MRALLAALFLTLFTVQLLLTFKVNRLEENQKASQTMELGRYNYKNPQGIWCHYVQWHDETRVEFSKRVAGYIKGGEAVPEGIKSETWTDSKGGVHQVTLAHDPAWTLKEFCRRFDHLVELFQKEFPCD